MISKYLKLSAVSAAILFSAVTTTTVQAEVSASVGIANMYLWRGVDLGKGEAAVSGELKYSNSGFYTGIWGSSGDTENGNEYDLFLGYGGEAGDLSYGISYWSYIYPSSDVGFGDAADLVLSLGYGSASLAVYENITEDDDAEDTRYVTLGYDINQFGFLIGQHDNGSIKSEHVQLGYDYNDNLSFAVSKFLDDDMFDDDVQFLVSYSFYIK